ncbi:MAG: type I-G CRISPR-associated protein Csb2 [Vicinamibacterales bacterium]
MSRALIITVRLHDARYHGLPEWPPSPARLFQALVAGAAAGPLAHEDRQMLRWLEGLASPVVAFPATRAGQRFMTYVPNNDLDAVGRDPRRTSEIRTGKWIRPRLVEVEPRFLYAWSLGPQEEDERNARAVCTMASRLYQFGRGLDMAWASGEVVGCDELDARLKEYPGLLFRPSGGGGGRELACPTSGSLASLEARYAASRLRFKVEGRGKAAREIFAQPPDARFVPVGYECPPRRFVYELRAATSSSAFAPWPSPQTSKLVEIVRDLAVDRLSLALPHAVADIHRALLGRPGDNENGVRPASRVRIVPLPSIGHRHADHAIRRLLVEVPAGCVLRADDVHWALSGLELADSKTGEVCDVVLLPADDEVMLRSYGLTGHSRSRLWRTVTPAALPESAKRRRLDPLRATEPKGGAEYALEQTRAAAAVVQALRHAEVRARTDGIRVQREPFHPHGERVEAFASGTRFAKERMWHVEVAFSTAVNGPLLMGDGRFLGLGLMAPVQQDRGIHVFAVEGGLAAAPQPIEIARAMRRAVMARVQDVLGPRAALPSFFSGHAPEGSPAPTEDPHLAFVFDSATMRLLILAPHIIDRRAPIRGEAAHLTSLDAALEGFTDLRAGSSGRLTLRAIPADADADPLLAPSRVWQSVTEYQVTRHAKRMTAAEALSTDLLAECRRRELPAPRVTPQEALGVPRVGLVGRAVLTFEVAVRGPIVLGRSRHLGGGVFTGIES